MEEGSVRARVGPAALLLVLAPLQSCFFFQKIRSSCFKDFDKRISKCFGQLVSKQVGI